MLIINHEGNDNQKEPKDALSIFHNEGKDKDDVDTKLLSPKTQRYDITELLKKVSITKPLKMRIEGHTFGNPRIELVAMRDDKPITPKAFFSDAVRVEINVDQFNDNGKDSPLKEITDSRQRQNPNYVAVFYDGVIEKNRIDGATFEVTAMKAKVRIKRPLFSHYPGPYRHKYASSFWIGMFGQQGNDIFWRQVGFSLKTDKGSRKGHWGLYVENGVVSPTYGTMSTPSKKRPTIPMKNGEFVGELFCYKNESNLIGILKPSSNNKGDYIVARTSYGGNADAKLSNEFKRIAKNTPLQDVQIQAELSNSLSLIPGTKDSPVVFEDVKIGEFKGKRGDLKPSNYKKLMSEESPQKDLFRWYPIAESKKTMEIKIHKSYRYDSYQMSKSKNGEHCSLYHWDGKVDGSRILFWDKRDWFVEMAKNPVKPSTEGKHTIKNVFREWTYSYSVEVKDDKGNLVDVAKEKTFIGILRDSKTGSSIITRVINNGKVQIQEYLPNKDGKFTIPGRNRVLILGKLSKEDQAFVYKMLKALES